jgi:O-acetyl-ADP-ribose deacetylase (regulator of RNase III)
MATIETATGNIFTARVEALVNPVNCVGVMGKGLALAFKKAFPPMFEDYRKACTAGELEPGRVHVWENPGASSTRFVINFPTKRHFRSKSRLDDIEATLPALVQAIESHQIASVAIPALGAGLGGLHWDDVEPRIRSAVAPLSTTEVVLYVPR